MSRAEAAVVKVGIADVQVARYPDKIRNLGTRFMRGAGFIR